MEVNNVLMEVPIHNGILLVVVVVVQVRVLTAGCIKYAASSILGETPARRWLMCARAVYKIRCALL